MDNSENNVTQGDIQNDDSDFPPKSTLYSLFLLIANAQVARKLLFNKKKQLDKTAEVDLLNDNFLRQITRLTRSSTSKLNSLCPIENPCSYNVKKLIHLAHKECKYFSENFADYCVGGYMSVKSGQIVGPNREYQIIRKLGWGQFSTVWLAKNLDRDNTCVAIKILKSCYQCKTAAFEEALLLEYVKARDPSHPGYNKFVIFYDMFYSLSYNGDHPCLVFEPMSITLLDLLNQSNFNGLDLQGVRNIIKQILLGLTYLHEACHIIHTDLKPENVLVTIKESQLRRIIECSNLFNEYGVQKPKTYVSAEEWTEYEDECSKLPKIDPNIKPFIKRGHSCPNNSKKPNIVTLITKKLRKWTNNRLFVDPNIQVKIADLGNSCWQTQKLCFPIQTLQYRAFEVIIEADYSYPVDIWSVGCLAYELCTGDFLFDPKVFPKLNSQEHHVQMIGQVLSEIPQHVALGGKISNQFFSASGAFLKTQIGNKDIDKVSVMLKKKYKWDEEDAVAFEDFVNSLIDVDPATRANASIALGHSWLN